MKGIAAIVAVALIGDAHAQPAPPAPPADPYPAPLEPQPEPPAEPAQPQQPVQLTVDEAVLLQRGEIDETYFYGSILANAVIGFGLGQAIQGRWRETGWKFTVGMGLGTVLFFAAANREEQSQLLVLPGAITIVTFYVWGLADAAVGARAHNRRVRDIKMKHGIPIHARIAPFVNRSRDGGTAGLMFRF